MRTSRDKSEYAMPFKSPLSVWSGVFFLLVLPSILVGLISLPLFLAMVLSRLVERGILTVDYGG